MKMYFRIMSNKTWYALHNDKNVIAIRKDFAGNGKNSNRWYYVAEGIDVVDCKRVIRHLKIDHPDWSFAKGEIKI